MGRLSFFLLALPLAATPTYTNTGSASVTCPPLSGLGAYITEQSTGPQAAANCPTGYVPASAFGSANGLGVSGQASSPAGAPSFGSFNYSSVMDDTITNTNGTGQGIEEFAITFVWDSLNSPGSADSAASLSYNGAIAWQQDEPGHGHTMPNPTTSTAIVDELFTYGVPFSLEARVAVSGTGGLSYADGTLSISESDSGQVPEPGSGLLVTCGLILPLLRLTRRSLKGRIP